jgi:hypothetical protein
MWGFAWQYLFTNGRFYATLYIIALNEQTNDFLQNINIKRGVVYV